MNREKVLSSKNIFEGRAVNLRIETVQMPDGRVTTREIVEHTPCVAIVAVDADDNILLVKQYRDAVDKELLEVPAGGIEPGEDPENAVKREMSEETGYLPQKVDRLGGFYSAPGFCTEYLYLFLATDLIPHRLVAEDTGSISLVRVPISEVLELIMSNTICDAKSIAGLLTYLEYRKVH